MRLDVYLTEYFEGAHSRSQINSAIKSGHVTVNGAVVTKSGTIVQQTDVINAVIEPEIFTAEPEDIKIDIVFEDAHLMIINKPRGLVVHPGAGNKSGTLLNGLLGLLAEDRKDGLERAGIVHRLDKNTAGLMVVAKTAEAQAGLAAMFEKHEIKRTYIGLVEGILNGEGTIDKNIIRDPNHRTLFKVSERGGRRAITHYKVLQNFLRWTLIEFHLETGRTHQIRVHCKSIGHPLVGDIEYNTASSVKFNGQLLESIAIEFRHPITGETVGYNIELTPEFRTILTKIY